MKISIIMTSYNYADFIKQGIDSVLSQTYKNWELIIVDDGSKDNSLEIIKNYTKNHGNIYLYTHPNNENKGLSKSIQLGLQKTTGKYVAFLESDDYWENSYLEEKIKVLEKHLEVKFIFNTVKFFGDDEVVEKYRNNTLVNELERTKSDTYHWIFCSFFNMSVVATLSSVLVDKKVLKECDFDAPYDVFTDWWLYHQIAMKHKMYCINKELTYWHLHKKSYSNEKYDAINQQKKEDFYKKLYQNYILNLNLLKINPFKKIILLIFLCIKWITVPFKVNKIFRGKINEFHDWILSII